MTVLVAADPGDQQVLIERLAAAARPPLRVLGAAGALRTDPSVRGSVTVVGPEWVGASRYARAARGAGAHVLLLTRERVTLDHPRFALGLRGVLGLDVAPTRLARGVDAIAAGLIVVEPPGAREASGAVRYREAAEDGDGAPGALSARERAVLELLAAGAANKTIARRLEVTPNTVKYHLRALYAKLGVRSRGEAVAEGIRRGELAL